MGSSYTKSELKALQCGFKEVPNSDAHNHKYFLKNGLKWIRDIGALKHTLRITDDRDLAALGYDVDAYYNCN
jgi:hypothetical protein